MFVYCTKLFFELFEQTMFQFMTVICNCTIKTLVCPAYQSSNKYTNFKELEGLVIVSIHIYYRYRIYRHHN